MKLLICCKNPPKQAPLFTASKQNTAAVAATRQNLDDFRAAQQQLHPQNIPLPIEKSAKPAENIVRENPAAIDFSAKINVQENKSADCTNDTENMQEAANLLPIGQIDACFIVAQGPNGGMYIIDQHAAHERILYDKFAKQTDRIAVQPLLVHLILDVNSAESDLIEQYQSTLYELGFNAELAGQNQIRLKEIPADIKSSEAETIFREILHSLAQLHAPTPQEIRHSCLAMTACKAAIKAGDILNIAQMKIILNELASTTLPYTCPHGRPTIIKFSTYDLEKMFKRVQ